MLDWPVILAAGDDFGSELLYVIIVLALAGIGAIAEKLKQKKAGQSKTPPRRPTPPRPTIPPRPQQQQPQAPRPPVVWEARPPQRTARPQPPAKPRPSAPRPAPPAARPAQDRRVLVQPSSPPVGSRPVSPVSPSLTPVVEVISEGARGQLVTAAVKKEDAAVARHEGPPLTGPPAPATGPRHPGLAWLGLSRADLPRAVILSEILSPPVGLREQERLF